MNDLRAVSNYLVLARKPCFMLSALFKSPSIIFSNLQKTGSLLIPDS